MIRPQPARWFEILVARDDTALALEALARTGAVELEARADQRVAAGLAELRPRCSQFVGAFAALSRVLARRRAWALAVPGDAGAHARPVPRRVRAWAQAAEPMIRALQGATAEREELARWRRVFGAHRR